MPHVHIVLAHPGANSYNAHLARLAEERLRELGWTATLSDLYAMGFDPCERAEHYADRHDGSRFDVQAEQRHACDTGTIPADVAAEIALLDRADLVILQYPMWWHLPPAILKGWFDRVFIYDAVYASKKRFEAGRFVGKKAMLSVTVATSPATYAHNGRSGDIDLLLWPVNFSLAYVGFEVLASFVGYGVESGLRYSSSEAVDARLRGIERDLAAALGDITKRPAIPFNRMADWTPEGIINPAAPVHSPFMRHQREMKLV